MGTKIKECNICKRLPEVIRLETGAFRVRCDVCLEEYNQTTWAFPTAEEAVAVWNKMVEPPPEKGE